MTPVRVQEMKDSEIVILTAVQKESSFDLSYSGPLRKLNPMMDLDGVIRRGGQLSLSTLQDGTKYPALLPRYGHIADLVIRYYHTSMQHQGREITMNELRAHGYWIIRASAAVSRVISKCVTCWKLRGVAQEQRMAELPKTVPIQHPPSPTVLSISSARSSSSKVVKNLSAMERFLHAWRRVQCTLK